MKSILEEFARGNIDPNTRYFRRDSAYGKAMQILTDYEDKLLAALNDDEKELYKSYFNAQMEVTTLSGIERFVDGYKLGALMMLELMLSKEAGGYDGN